MNTDQTVTDVTPKDTDSLTAGCVAATKDVTYPTTPPPSVDTKSPAEEPDDVPAAANYRLVSAYFPGERFCIGFAKVSSPDNLEHALSYTSLQDAENEVQAILAHIRQSFMNEVHAKAFAAGVASVSPGHAANDTPTAEV